MTDQAFLTPDEVAKMLRCKPEKIYRLLSSRELPSLRFGGRRLIAQSDLDAYLEKLKAAA